MREPLEKAIDHIRSEFPSITAAEQTAFELWDSCARERLVYIRDVSLGRVKPYVPLSAQSSGIELSAAYVQYLEKRRLYRTLPRILEPLGKIKDENDALIAASRPFDAPSFFSAVSQVATATQAVSASLEKDQKR